MKILLAILISSFLISVILETIYNMITLAAKNEFENNNPEELIEIDEKVLSLFYLLNKPIAIGELPVIDFLLKHGNILFFLIFSLTSLIIVYLEKHSIFFVLLCIPTLIFLYFITSLVSILFSTLFIKMRTEEEMVLVHV